MAVTTKTPFEFKNLSSPDEGRTMDHGTMERVNLAGATINRATFQPGWKWSTDLGPIMGTGSCQATHNSYIVSGRLHVRMDDGREYELGPGDAVVIPPGHDAWVVGDEACVNIDFAPTAGTSTGYVERCFCGVEFRVASGDQLDHLVEAIHQHASGAHGHELSVEDILAGVSTA